MLRPKSLLRISPFDLHVLSTPPAFILSQDQTLEFEFSEGKFRFRKMQFFLIFLTLLSELTLANSSFFTALGCLFPDRSLNLLFRIFRAALLFDCQGSSSVCLHCKRRRRDLNPRAAINDLHPFQGCPFSHLGYFSKCLNQHSNLFRFIISFIILYRNDLFQILRLHLLFSKRRGWDSNPRALADKRFSRPPRYDHFDTSPCTLLPQRKIYSSKQYSYCQQLFSSK